MAGVAGREVVALPLDTQYVGAQEASDTQQTAGAVSTLSPRAAAQDPAGPESSGLHPSLLQLSVGLPGEIEAC